MTDVIIPAQMQSHHRQRTSAIPVSSAAAAAMDVEMLPNPGFSFPIKSPIPNLQPSAQDTSTRTARRPKSMQLDSMTTGSRSVTHQRAVSTLPSFTFNAADASGLLDNSTPPMTPTEPIPIAAARRGHRRGHSEFVGGDSRLGVVEAISTSPTQFSALPLPIVRTGLPAGRRGHAHRRSAAMSSHDVSSIMTTAESQPRLSSSLPNTPLELPQRSNDTNQTTGGLPDPVEDQFGSPSDQSPTRPTKPRVGFSDDVEYIPRPLSISSETGSSMSTVRGHSVNDSMSSVLSLSTPSPPSSRNNPRLSLSTTFEDDAFPMASSPVDISRRVEREGEWLKSGSSSKALQRPISASSASPPSLTFAPVPQSQQTTISHRKRHSLGHALGFDRRRSAPEIFVKPQNQARLSAISLQEPASQDGAIGNNESQLMDKKSSSQKIKAWAASMLSKSNNKPLTDFDDLGTSLDASAGGSSPEATLVSLGGVPSQNQAGAETDLDAVFGVNEHENVLRINTPPQPRFSTPASSLHAFEPQTRRVSDELSPDIDLDAALGPFNIAAFCNDKPRRELHSSRGTKDFAGPGGHYQRHFRTASAPLLQSFHRGRSSSPSKSDMAVFAEEDEDDAKPDQVDVCSGSATTSYVSPVIPSTGSSTGVYVVDADTSSIDRHRHSENGLQVRGGGWDVERHSMLYGNEDLRLSPQMSDGRPSSIVEETIVEESSQPEVVEVVSFEEEPRSSSLTKSSDSSDTPTIFAAAAGGLDPANDHASSLIISTAYPKSTFSSPDLTRRQGSFDASRVGTSASSVGYARTMSSFATGEHSHDNRISSEGVPSLTSSRSTAWSTMYGNDSNRTVSVGDAQPRPLVAGPRNPGPDGAHRRKRASIASLSQLVSASFSTKSKSSDTRPNTAIDVGGSRRPRKEHRLKKLMFWKSMGSGKSSTSNV